MILRLIHFSLLLLAIGCGAAADRAIVSSYTPESAPWPTPDQVVELPQRQHPFLFLTRDDFTSLAERGNNPHFPWAIKQFNSIIESADAAVREPLVVPDLPGEWSHNYVCKGCGVALHAQADVHVCTRCGKSYDGWPYDGVVAGIEHSRNISNAETLGLAYQLTSRTVYADRAREILLAYADRYTSFPIHDYKGTQLQRGARLSAQTLNEAIMLIPASWSYDLIYNAQGMTAAHRKEIEERLLRPMAGVIRRNDMGVSNWQSWHNAAIAAAGFVLEDPVMVTHAVEGKSGFLYQMEESVLPDGFWYEGTASYHFYALKALEAQALMMKAAGMDTYRMPKFKALYESPLDYTFPDGRFPAVNDSDPLSIYGQGAHYEIAYALYGEDRFGGVAWKAKRDSRETFLFGRESLPQGAGRDDTSRVFPCLGAAMLRQGKTTAALAVHLDYGPHGGGHGHPDKLGIVFFANGHDVMPDAGRLQYGAPLHSRWYKTTLAHNTVVVDGKNQGPAEGKLVQYDFGGTIKLATAACDTAYADAALTRSIALAPDYMLDVMTGESRTSRTWDLAYHVRGEARTELPMTDFTLPEKSAGYQVLENVRAADVDEAWQMEFTHQRGVLKLLQASTGPATVISGDGFVDRTVTTCPAVLSRRIGYSPSWITLIAPGETMVEALEVEHVENGWKVQVRTGSGTDQYEIIQGAITVTQNIRKSE